MVDMTFVSTSPKGAAGHVDGPVLCVCGLFNQIDMFGPTSSFWLAICIICIVFFFLFLFFFHFGMKV